MTARPSAIAALYEAFAGCTIPEVLEYCTYCDHADHERALHAPLGELPADLMDKYLADAIHHTGTADDFAYFVPRLVELEHAHQHGLSFFQTYFADRLHEAGYPRWPAERRAALCRALESAARAHPRSDAWLDTVARVDGVDWNEIFPKMPGLDEALSGQLDWLAIAISRRAVTDEPSAINRALESWLDSPAGARQAEALLARWTEDG